MYLAKYDQPPPNSNDLNKFKDFLRQKYIEKRWFVDPNKPVVVNDVKSAGSNVSSVSPILPAVPALSKTRTSFKKPGNGINNVDLLANDFVDTNPKIVNKSNTFDAFSNNSFDSFNNSNDLFSTSTNNFGSSTAPTNNFGEFSNKPSNSFISPVNSANNSFGHSNFDFPQSNSQFANFNSPATNSSSQNAFSSFNSINSSTTAATPFDVYQPPTNTGNSNSFDPFVAQTNNPVKAVNTLELFGEVNSHNTNNDIKPKTVPVEKNFNAFDDILSNNQPIHSVNPFDQFASSHQSTHDATRNNNHFNTNQLPTGYQQQAYAQNVPRTFPPNSAPGSYQNYPPNQVPQQQPHQLTPQQISQQLSHQQVPPQQVPPPQQISHLIQHLPQQVPPQQLPQQKISQHLPQHLPQELPPQQLPQQLSQQSYSNQYLPQQLPPQHFPQQQSPGYPNQYPPQHLQSTSQPFPHDPYSQTSNNPFYQQTNYQQPAPANVYTYNNPAVPPSPQIVSQSYSSFQNTYPPAQYNNPFNSPPSQQLPPQPPVTSQSAPLVAANDPFSEMINLGLKSLDKPAPPLTKKAVVAPLEPEEMYPREVVRSVPPAVSQSPDWTTTTNQNISSNQVFGDTNRQTQPINYPPPAGNPF
eukprot:CAMPEP_0196761338 /NCGR_PEP_ID=MMETSP1095-20130614/538_1 /TAXON_ID=96789 ORGANISM="Chromulina nebulosa, Strain UTEXLB2642" /NCGR_SAMPLE_ID=MMETSP1095 /ASSEMBLY_ACC=CAM_ASM_000446 /LENGTH=635 /DNA_ID=CAMNT_0042110745 /DNA_START=290 /DNA_END=2194 /DNA_ORIENTATION=+